MDAPTQLLMVIIVPLLVCATLAALLLLFDKGTKLTSKLWINQRCINCKTNLCWSCTQEGSREHQAYWNSTGTK